MKNKNDDLWTASGALAAAAILFFSFASWIAGAANLDLGSASFILLGGLLAAVILAGADYFELNKRALAPWIIVLVAPSFVPALTYWASAGPGPFHMKATQDMAWFGNTWWLLFIWVGLGWVVRCRMRLQQTDR
jgi:hypothetical protein